MNKLRTIFMGTPDFAAASLEVLLNRSDIEIVGVVTQPDRPRGRGHKLLPSPVKVLAQNNSLPILQPERIKNDNFIEEIRSLNPDLIIVAAYGKILPQSILDMPRFGCINVHASLLPRYRGAAPIEWCLINGETKSGVTTMMMDVGLDTGDMLVKRDVDISDEMILPELHDALMRLGADALIETLDRLSSGSLERVKQDDTQSNYAPMINKETGRIDWTKSARQIHNLVRGLCGRAFAIFNDQTYKVWRTRVVNEIFSNVDAGQIVRADKNGLLIGTGDGVIEILEIQAPNSKKLSAIDFLKGHKLTGM